MEYFVGLILKNKIHHQWSIDDKISNYSQNENNFQRLNSFVYHYFETVKFICT